MWRLVLLWVSGMYIASAAADTRDLPAYGAWGVDLSAMDVRIVPGVNFNDYANGAWIARTQMPPDKALVTLRSSMSDVIEARLHSILSQAAQTAPERPVTLTQKVGAFYQSYIDEARVEALGIKPIEESLQAVRTAVDRRALAFLMGKTNVDFEGSLFTLRQDIDLKDVDHYAIYIGQGGLGLPDRDYYLKPSFSAQKKAYRQYVATLLHLIHWPHPDVQARSVVEFERQIAAASAPKVEQREIEKNYHPVTRGQLTELAPGFEWESFLRAAGLHEQGRLVLAEKESIRRIAALFRATPIGVIKAWLAFTIADNSAFYLSSAFTHARFEFRNKVLSGEEDPGPRWKQAIKAVAGGECTGERADCFGNLGFGVGQLYAERYFPAASKAKIEALVADLKEAMRVRLEHLDWMSAPTKAEALKKLATFTIKVGYPDHPRDYSKVEVRADDLMGNVRRAAESDWQYRVNRWTGNVDRSEWLLAAHSNDAYNGTLRDIVFPAGILQPPIFDPYADAAVNYGAIGAVIGHELTHGFDDEGRKLDAAGTLRDWWTPADAAEFTARAKRLSAQYSQFEPLAGVRINGDLTLGENIADLGGLNIALDAYRRHLRERPAPILDGFSGEQRIFLGWAQAWRGKAREEYVRQQVASDEHSPRAYRVIGPVRNIDAWYNAFGVKAGQPDYLAPEQRVRIW